MLRLKELDLKDSSHPLEWWCSISKQSKKYIFKEDEDWGSSVTTSKRLKFNSKTNDRWSSSHHIPCNPRAAFELVRATLNIIRTRKSMTIMNSKRKRLNRLLKKTLIDCFGHTRKGENSKKQKHGEGHFFHDTNFAALSVSLCELWEELICFFFKRKISAFVYIFYFLFPRFIQKRYFCLQQLNECKK